MKKIDYISIHNFEVSNVNGYESYLESLLELKEKEIEVYKSFIENKLNCIIKNEVVERTKFDERGLKEVRFKVITIPQSQYVIEIDT